MRLLWEDRAWEDYLAWFSEDKKKLERVNKLLTDMKRNPQEGIGKPERLKGEMSGWWSRRIDEGNRIVYKPVGDTIIIAQCKTHYGK